MNNLLKLIRGRDIQIRAVVITALASYFMQLSGILLHWHLWAIALATLIPWIPLFTMKVLWNSKHYGFMAIYAVLMLVQAGHVGEHLFQMGEYIFYHEHTYQGRILAIDSNTLNTPKVKVTDADPPQADLVISKTATQDVRTITVVTTGETITGRAVVFEGCQGWSWNGPGCNAAHGVFGELDRELIHFIWDGLILIACTLLMFKFPKNPWTKWAFLFALIHQIEHIFLFGINVFDYSHYIFTPADALAGKAPPTYFGVSVLQPDQGLLGHNGVVGCAFGCSLDPNKQSFFNAIVPNRINIHFIYNSFVFAPMVGAFVYQVRRIYDEWLAKALPSLSREQLIQFSQYAQTAVFKAGQTIFAQGDAADRFYIITKGQVEVLRGDKRGIQKPIAALSEGAYFGEIGILGRTRRTATVKALTDVEVLGLDEVTFRSMVAASADSYRDLDFVVKRRIKQLGAVTGKNLEQKVDANPDLLVKSRIIQGWLDDMELKSQLLNWQGLAEPVAVGSSAPTVPQPVANGNGALPAFPNAQAAVHTPPQGQPAAQPFYQATVQRQALQNGNENPNNAGVIAPPRIIGSLKVRTGPSTGQRFEITAPRVLVGRRSNKVADVPIYMLDDPRVSREHIEIVTQPDGIYLRDLGSSNGTWYNGTQLEGTPVRLDDGAEIRLGTDTVVTFRYGQ
jgi:CRP-like cAMP-binding protein